jgi:subtilisin family serine protease
VGAPVSGGGVIVAVVDTGVDAAHPTFGGRVLPTIDLVDGTGNYHTRGAGCPALAPLRRAATRLDGRRRWPRNLPQPGQRVIEVALDGPPSRCPTSRGPQLRWTSS